MNRRIYRRKSSKPYGNCGELSKPAPTGVFWRLQNRKTTGKTNAKLVERCGKLFPFSGNLEGCFSSKPPHFCFCGFSCFPRCGKPLPFPRKSGKTNAKPNFSTAACQTLFQKRQPAPQRGFANFINSKPQVTKPVFHQFSTGVENCVEKSF